MRVIPQKPITVNYTAFSRLFIYSVCTDEILIEDPVIYNSKPQKNRHENYISKNPDCTGGCNGSVAGHR
jgi:hypothetical protein